MVDFKIWCKSKKEIEVMTSVLDQLGVVGLLSGATAKRLMDLNLNKLGIFVRDGKFTYTTLPETYEKCSDLTEIALSPKTTNAEPTINDLCAAANEMGYHARVEIRDGEDALIFSSSEKDDLFYYVFPSYWIRFVYVLNEAFPIGIIRGTAKEMVTQIVDQVRKRFEEVIELYGDIYNV